MKMNTKFRVLRRIAPALVFSLLASAPASLASAQAAGPRLVVQSAPQVIMSFSFALSNNNRLLASAGDKEGHVSIWEVASGRLLCTLDAGLSGNSSMLGAGLAGMTFSADGNTIATVADDSDVVVWDLARCGESHRVSLSPAQRDSAKALSTIADGRVLVLAGDSHLYFADIFRGKGQLEAVAGADEADALLAHTRDGSVILESGKQQSAGAMLPQNVLRIRNVDSGTTEYLDQYKGAPPRAGFGGLIRSAAALSPSGRRVVALESGRLVIYDRQSRSAVVDAAPATGATPAPAPIKPPTLKMDDRILKQLELLPPEMRAKMQQQLATVMEQAQSAANSAMPTGNVAANVTGAATTWVGFSSDEKHVLVWRNDVAASLQGGTTGSKRGAHIEVRRVDDLQIERSVGFDKTLSDNAVDNLLATSFASSADGSLLVLGAANLVGGKLAVVDFSRTEPRLRSWTASHGVVASLTWTGAGKLMSLHQNQLGQMSASLAPRGGGLPALPGALAGIAGGLGGAGAQDVSQIDNAIKSRLVSWDLRAGDTVGYPLKSVMMQAPLALGNQGRFAAVATVLPPTMHGPRAQFLVQVIDAQSLQTVRNVELLDSDGKPHTVPPQAIAVSPDAKLLASIWSPQPRRGQAREQQGQAPRARIELHDTASGRVISAHDLTFKLGIENGAGSVMRFSADGRALFVVAQNQALIVEIGDNGNHRAQFVKTDTALYGVLDGNPLKLVVADGPGQDASATDSMPRVRIKRGAYSNVASNATGTLLAVAAKRSGDIELMGINATHATDSRLLKGHAASVHAMAFSPDGRLLASTSEDGATLLWDVQTGKWIARLHAFADGTWAVVDPAGRFDTNDLENIEQLHWVLADEPLRARPLEIFMRDFFEPRLLSRILAGEALPPVRELSALNLAQPEVEIRSIEPVAGDAQRVAVTVVVKQTADRRGAAGGVFDVKLFRDGTLVANAPQAPGAVDLDARTGEAQLRFDNIRLPARGGNLSFSAYAFNRDRIKSATTYAHYQAPARSASDVMGRAYLISMGVNAHENASWDLSFAVNDAQRIQQVVSAQLAATGKFAEVIPVALIADQSGARDATKQTLRSVFAALAGGEPNRDVLSHLPNGNRLRAATPDDVVILSFSGHGIAAADGEFYLLPSDIGSGDSRDLTASLLGHGISTDELASWFRDVDAADIAFIIDACQSAASVEKEGFKPGPMGSKGLGQLAYDKGIRILAASQADNVALEPDVLRHGLLTHALVNDGIVARRADSAPADSLLHLHEWLQFGVLRVPQLYTEMLNGEIPVNTDDRGAARVDAAPDASVDTVRVHSQEPRLFDFHRAASDSVIARFK
jgi:WD40 repeat protein